MSKRALKKYMATLKEEALREQLMDLYDRFPEVKTYYDFVFNPREDQLLKQAMESISEEYFQRRRKKAKARRSVAHKYIRHFETLGVDPSILGELMVFNLETALRYERQRNCPEAFYRSIYKSFRQWGSHLQQSGLYREEQERFLRFVEQVREAGWPNHLAFSDFRDQLENE